jgi:hypothetical protein
MRKNLFKMQKSRIFNFRREKIRKSNITYGTFQKQLQIGKGVKIIAEN